MGARPVASWTRCSSARSRRSARTRYPALGGVVGGIGGYGNCVGVPTVGGEVMFDAPTTAISWSTRSASGSRRTTRLSSARASGLGNPVLYVGSATGRDGIHGATCWPRPSSTEASASQASDGAGRRSVHRKAADRGVPGGDADRRDRRDPGHGRGGAHLVSSEMAARGGTRHRARPRPQFRCAKRD